LQPTFLEINGIRTNAIKTKLILRIKKPIENEVINVLII